MEDGGSRDYAIPFPVDISPQDEGSILVIETREELRQMIRIPSNEWMRIESMSGWHDLLEHTRKGCSKTDSGTTCDVAGKIREAGIDVSRRRRSL